jgi:hypothetical protein
MKKKTTKSGSPPQWYGELAEQALRSAVAKLIQERQHTGESLILWRDGRVAHVAADELKVPTHQRLGRKRRAKSRGA